MDSIFLFIALAAVGISIVLGIRWRKEKNLLFKEIIKSKQNIAMGLMSIFIALYIMFRRPELSFNLSLIFTILLISVGLFNLVQGIRMHRHYTKQQPNQT